IESIVDDKSRIVKNAWKSIFSGNKTRQFYLCNPKDFESAIKDLADKYKSEKTEKSVPIAVHKFSDIEVKNIDWLWYPYIAKGNITILYAAPGTGKTFLTCWLASRLSKGEPLPDAVPEEWEKPPQGITMFFNAEDPADRTLKPRLIGCGADMESIVTAEEWESKDFIPYSFTDPRLPKLFEKVRPELVIFDPMQSYIGADIDMHRANQTRPILAHINYMAKIYNFALVIVCHINKMTNQEIGDRIIGSQDIKGAARSVLFLGQHPEISEAKVLFQTKNNLAEWGRPLAFRIDNSGTETSLELDCSVDIRDLTPERCSSSITGKAREYTDTQKSLAEEVLKELFKDRDIIPSDELKTTANDHNITWKEFQKVLSRYAKWKRSGFGNNATDYYVKRQSV
ncbi:MAG: AAA family ATPase, partial [Firmicutes bacterium]|nr:AAA family ATPase [Bacillota bacterium]